MLTADLDLHIPDNKNRASAASTVNHALATLPRVGVLSVHTVHSGMKFQDQGFQTLKAQTGQIDRQTDTHTGRHDCCYYHATCADGNERKA